MSQALIVLSKWVDMIVLLSLDILRLLIDDPCLDLNPIIFLLVVRSNNSIDPPFNPTAN